MTLLTALDPRAVYPDGKVCISILHSPGDDPMGYEKAAERWLPVHTVETILVSVISMLSVRAAFRLLHHSAVQSKCSTQLVTAHD